MAGDTLIAPVRYHRRYGVNTPRPYVLEETVVYYSAQYGKFITLHAGMESDGATGAFDIESLSWWVHDHICDNPVWDDGSKITAWQAAHVLKDILLAEGRPMRSVLWSVTTFLFGCHEARKNGWF